MNYKRICNNLADYGQMIKTDESQYDYIKDDTKDWYLSVYEYSQTQKDLATQTITRDGKKTPRGVAGIREVYTKSLIFDFDIPKNSLLSLEDVKKDTLTLIDRLAANGVNPDDLQITFSGNKGFGVVLQTNQYMTPLEHKTMAKELGGDLQTWDSKVYNASRILRIPLTKHQKSGLYKIPITYDELKNTSTDEIMSWASENMGVEQIKDWGNVVDLPPELEALKHVKSKGSDNGSNAFDVKLDLDIKKKPRWLSNWKYALVNGYFPPGSRSHAMMILAATFRGQGFPKEVAGRMLKGAAELQAERFGQEKFANDEIWGNQIKQVYDDFWQGGTYAEENFPEEIKEYLTELGIPNERAEQEERPIESVDDVYSVFEKFAENIDQNTIITGIDELDNKVKLTTSMLVGLLGAPGAGKTSAVLKILNEQSNKNETGIFFSLDMGRPLVYAKMAQRFTGMDFDQVLNVFKNKDEKKKEEIRNKINDNYKNVDLCFKTGATVSDMKRYIENYQDTTGKRVKMVVVDYLEKVVGPFSDATANSASVAKELQGLANELDICVIVLLQPQKMAGTPSDKLDSYRKVKGASVIEQDCRAIISVYREGYSPTSYENDRYITFTILKNTMGRLGSVDCSWDGVRGEIFPIDEVDKRDLEELRKQKKMEESLKDF
jgi:KaiC/GvpD/RAD55 family RecA-like ATPase